MSLLNNWIMSSKTRGMEVQPTVLLEQLCQYVVCAGLGLLGGAIGVAIAIGLALILQLWLSSTTMFSPGVVPLALIAVVTGLGVSWLLSWAATRILHTSFDQRVIQVMLIISGLTSLLQTFLFMPVV